MARSASRSVLASLSKTVSEDTVASASSRLPGASATSATSATSENSSLGGDADLSSGAGATSGGAALGGSSTGSSELTELGATSEVTSGAASAASGGAASQTSCATGGRAASELTTSSGTSASLASVASTAGRLTEPLAGSPASHASGVGSALTLVGLGGDLIADGSHAVGASVVPLLGPLGSGVPVWVVSATRVVGVGPEWVATSGEAALGSVLSGLVLTSVSAIASDVLVALIKVVSAGYISVSSESAEGRARAPLGSSACLYCALCSSLQLR